MAERFPAETFHPGEYIRDELAERGMSPADLAIGLGLSAESIAALLSGAWDVTPEVADGLGLLFGTGAAFWTNLQRTHRPLPLAREGSV